MTLIFTGGGTGGHLVIALSLAQEAKARGHKVIFIGSTSGQDRQWFGNSTVFEEACFLETTGVVNKKGLGKLGALWKILKAVVESRRIIRACTSSDQCWRIFSRTCGDCIDYDETSIVHP